MTKIETLRKHGLFDAKVPRYTSYPPANHFDNVAGQRNQRQWLEAVTQGDAISVYIHIPFCKRLCWFCACRTQGTQTMRPVDAYVDVLLQEIATVRAALPHNLRMGRLHLGGGTPTILSQPTMGRLLDHVFAAFDPADDMEFSVEIDPTEATDGLLDLLVDRGLTRASIGVQDFAPQVQDAIGRQQSFAQTKHVVDVLRAHGQIKLNLDVLYGLPFQIKDSFRETLNAVSTLGPDRLAIYGYAHVPWMSKRQVMIKDETLPDAELRFELAEIARAHMVQDGFDVIGIDHFAKPDDPLAQAAKQGKLRRNFQGYTDDQCETLVGLGASAISKFYGGYVQNAAATSAYIERIGQTGLAGFRGYEMGHHDRLIAQIVNDLMCRFAFRQTALCALFPDDYELIRATAVSLMQRFDGVFYISDQGLEIHTQAHSLVRVIASFVDQFTSEQAAHSSAI